MSSQDSSDQPIRVLIVDEEQAIVDVVELGLRYEGFEVQSVGTGSAALERFNAWAPQLIILDVNLPDMEGFEVCRRIRSSSDALIIILTIRGEVSDKIHGLELGADDYLTKPFDFFELRARIRAALRRHLPPPSNVISIGPLTLNARTREVWRDAELVELTRREFDLLHLLMQHPGQVLERKTILDRVWGYDYYGDTKIIEVYVSYLRSKVDTEPPTLIQTVRGVGYMLRDPALG